VDARKIMKALFILIALGCGGFLFWRYFWFFRNPKRRVPEGEGVLSPADGKVVYVRKVEAKEPVVTIKKGQKACIVDILKEDVNTPKLIIGVFRSPFDVHYNRAPLSGEIQCITHYPAQGVNVHMGSMHWRCILNRFPLYQNCRHIIQNERTVTRIKALFKGSTFTAYIIQIAAKSVRGIDVFIPVGGFVQRGEIFGMIRIGSQVDLVVPWLPDMEIKVAPGDRVRAGESELIA
jgi:phosphatidylserine decarboxylase